MPTAWEQRFVLNPDWADDAQLDSDGDGVSNLREYLADTDPRNRKSLLKISKIKIQNGKVYLEWIGGTNATQYLEWTDSLDKPWSNILTRTPPTAQTNVLENAPMDRGFYRIRARKE